MQRFEKKFVEEFISSFEAKFPNVKCPVCGHSDFELLPGYHVHALQTNTDFAMMPPKGAKTVTLACKTCGYLLNFMVSAYVKDEQ